MKLGLLLIAMGFGYKIYAEASKEKGSLRSLGQWIGTVMMGAALVVSAFHLYLCSTAFTGGEGPCPWKGLGRSVQTLAEEPGK